MSIKHLERSDKIKFIDEAEIQQALHLMESDSTLKTKPGYKVLYTNRIIPFSEKHMTYLKNHPKVNPQHYLANLRTMIKIRR